jgi:cyclophilin family peptidyl-prolyl cis-trans isomerase
MSSGYKSSRPSSSSRAPSNRARLGLETLEGREVPATLAPISDISTPAGKFLFLPLTVTNTSGAVSYTATSGNSQVQTQVITTGTTIKMNVSGTAGDGTSFTGDLTLRLFDSLAPNTVNRIVQLVEDGFYDDVIFHRILNGFVAQGGDPTGTGTGGSGVKQNDEFNSKLTFNSPGLLAMANAGDDTGDSQFFITDIDLTLAQQPQHLNFQHTIFGQLVAGFDTFTKLMSTPVQSPSTGRPTNPVTINSATIVQNDPNAILQVTAPSSFRGTTAITVTPSDSGTSTGDTFNVTFVEDTVNDPPFLGPIANQTTTVGTGITFQLTSTDLENDPVTYALVSATNASGQAVNVTSSVDQSTGKMTVTPPANFTGVIKLTVGVKDAASSFDTQTINLTVNGNFDLESSSDTGTANDDNITGSATPTLTVLAPAGQTVTVTVNGVSIGNAAATDTAGQYRITIPANTLRVGLNTIAGIAVATGGSSTSLAAFGLTYTPSLRNLYVVPGAIGSSQQVSFAYRGAETSYDNELGYIKVDDQTGRIGTLRPGDSGYFAAAMARRQILFQAGTAVGATTTITASGGDLLMLYLVKDSTSADLLAQNSSNTPSGNKPLAFFSIAAANPDDVEHVATSSIDGASQAIYGWEDDTSGGDRDYNDAVLFVKLASDITMGSLPMPIASGRTITLESRLEPASKPRGTTTTPTTTSGGEIGAIIVDDATGKIGNLTPGSQAWIAAALGSPKILFSSTAAVNSNATASYIGGQFVMFYYVPGGTASGVITDNPTNSLTGGQGKVAYFSIASANPDGKEHFRTSNPEGVTRTAPTASDPLRFHLSGKANPTNNDFDDAVFTISFRV